MTSPVEYVAAALSITASAIKTVKGVYEFLDRVKQVDREIDSLRTKVQVWQGILESINSYLELRRRSKELAHVEAKYLDYMSQVISLCEKDVQALQYKIPKPEGSMSRRRNSTWRENTAAAIKLHMKEDRRLIDRIAGYMQLLSHLNFLCPVGELFSAQNQERLGKLPQIVSENNTRPSSRATSPSTRPSHEVEEEKVITEFEEATYEYTTFLITKGHDFTPPIEPTMEEIQIQFEANQAIVGYLFDKLKLPGNAYWLHKRGMEIWKAMDGIELDFDTYVRLNVRLINILLACNTPERTKEAYEILREMDETSWDNNRPQRFDIRLRFAELCFKLQDMKEADKLLRALYTEYKKEPVSYQDELLKVVQLIDQGYREAGKFENSTAWRVLVERDLGVDLFPSHNLSRTLDWCISRGFDVSEVRRGVPFDQIRNHQGDSPLHDAARNPESRLDILEILEDLLAQTHSLDGRDRRGNTVLMIAAEGSGEVAVEVMNILLARSTPADLIATGGDEDETPLHRCRDPGIAALLIESAACPYSCMSTNSGEGSFYDNVAMNKVLNNQDGWYKKTPLHTACQYARTEVVKTLLSYGADPSLQDLGDQVPGQKLPSSIRKTDKLLIIEQMCKAYTAAGKCDSDKKKLLDKLLDDDSLTKNDRKALRSKEVRRDRTPSASKDPSFGSTSRRSSETTANTSLSSRSDPKSSTEAPRLSVAIESFDIQFDFHAGKEGGIEENYEG